MQQKQEMQEEDCAISGKLMAGEKVEVAFELLWQTGLGKKEEDATAMLHTLS